MDVYGRVARLLLELAEESGGKLSIQQRLTQQDIASRIGIVLHRKPPEHW